MYIFCTNIFPNTPLPKRSKRAEMWMSSSHRLGLLVAKLKKSFFSKTQNDKISWKTQKPLRGTEAKDPPARSQPSVTGHQCFINPEGPGGFQGNQEVPVEAPS